MVLASPYESLADRMPTLNTNKAHSLRDKSLEVIRMAHRMAKRQPLAKAIPFSTEFAAPELPTIGILYEKNTRLAGGSSPLPKKVSRLSERSLSMSLRTRLGYVARQLEIDSRVKSAVARLETHGFNRRFSAAML